MKNFKFWQKLCVISQLVLASLMFTSPVFAGDHHEESTTEPEKGSHGGRLLTDGNFSLELTLFERGIPPEFRVYLTLDNQAIEPNKASVNIKLHRLGNVIDNIEFTPEGDYLRGNMEVVEPHSFEVEITASYNNKQYQWHYENFEGRTTISNAMAEEMGVATEQVSKQTLTEQLTAYGKLALPANAQRKVTARFPGEVKALYTSLGKSVKKGQKLLTIESNESLQRYHVYAPISGIISKQFTAQGEQATDSTLLVITDLSTLNAEIAIYPKDISQVTLGAQAYIKIPNTEKVLATKLSDRLPAVMQQATIYRAPVDNSDYSLLPGQFIEANIVTGSFDVDMAVKREALQSFRDFTVVYTKVGQTYEVRMLELGRKAGPWVEVLSGISSDAQYVTSNSYLIKADIDKSGASHDH